MVTDVEAELCRDISDSIKLGVAALYRQLSCQEHVLCLCFAMGRPKRTLEEEASYKERQLEYTRRRRAKEAERHRQAEQPEHAARRREYMQNRCESVPGLRVVENFQCRVWQSFSR